MDILNEYGYTLNDLDLNIKNLDSIVSSDLFQNIIPNHWVVEYKNKLKTCSRICGQEFNQFKDQYSDTSAHR